MAMLVIIGLFIIFYPKLTETKEIEIPSLSGKTIVEAESALKELGFKVNTDVKEQNNNEIDEGLVIGTSPVTGRKVKEGTEITLIISLGESGFTLEDYTKKSYYEIEAMLKERGMYVIVEKKEVEDKDKYTENIIIEQNPAVGTRVTEGDTITLYIPDIVTEYPDFTDGSWSISDIETFCKTYSITLTKDYQQTSEYTPGKIISQSRAKGTKVMPTTLKIVIAKAPDVIEPEEE